MDWQDREFHRVVNEGLVPRVANSDMCVSICPQGDGLDAKFCVELGVMIMLDKPIVALVHPEQTPPRKLALVADKIIYADITTDEGQEAIRDGLADFQRELDEKEADAN